MQKKKTTLTFKVLKWLIRLFYPKFKTVGTENLPDEPCIIVGNHCQLHGPLACELHFPVERYTWCAGQMMSLKDVPDYAYTDFWSGKSKYTRPFYRLLSFIIAPLSVCLFNNANTIGVYHDTRVLSTFKNTVNILKQGGSVVIFPEHAVDYNHILCDFQDKFIDVARLYHKKTGKAVCFVPLYIAPYLKTMYIGHPIKFDPDAEKNTERRRICDALMQDITALAESLPEHTVVPYRNISRKYYNTNLRKEEPYAKTDG